MEPHSACHQYSEDGGCTPGHLNNILLKVCPTTPAANNHPEHELSQSRLELRCQLLRGLVWTQTLQHADISVVDSSEFPVVHPWLTGPELVKFNPILNNDSNDASNKLDPQLPGLTLTSRIYANIDRAYLAICGHEEDFSRMPRIQFSLLSIIASYGANGVALTNLFGTISPERDKRGIEIRDLVRSRYVLMLNDTRTGSQRVVLARFGSAGITSGTAPSETRGTSTTEYGHAKAASTASVRGVSPRDEASSVRSNHENTAAYAVLGSNQEGFPATENTTPMLSMSGPIPQDSSEHRDESQAQTRTGAANGEYMMTRSKRLRASQSSPRPNANNEQLADHNPTTRAKQSLPSPSDDEPVAEIPTLPKEEQRQGESRGRPRKFVRGTEDFWREMCSEARQLANPGKKTLNKGGLMTDPAAVALFTGRPPTFDHTLLRAVDRGLPIPASPHELSQNWVDKIQRILDQPQKGASVSPRGVQPNGWVKSKPVSQVLVVRTPRLRELSLSSLHKVAEVRFYTSSAAHTLHFRRYYPSMPTKKPAYINLNLPAELRRIRSAGLKASVAEKSDKRSVQMSTAALAYNVSSLKRKTMSLDEPIDYVPSSPSLMQVLMAKKRKEMLSWTMTGPRKKRKKVFEFWEPVAPSPKRPVNAVLSDTESSQTRDQSNPYGLPPPMKTRHARRKEKNPDETPEPVQTQSVMRTSATLTGIAAERAVDEALARLDPQSVRCSMSSDYEDCMGESGTPEENPHSFSSVSELPYADGDRSWSPRKRQRLYLREGPRRGGHLSYVRRKIILEMVDQCSGAIPNNAICPAGAFAERIRGAGLEGPSDFTALKRAIKSLTDSGHLKLMKFSFKSKRGSIVTRAMLARAELVAHDLVVLRLQGKMIRAEPGDYVPPELGLGLGAYQQNLNATNLPLSLAEEHTRNLLTPNERNFERDRDSIRKRLPHRKIIHWGTSEDKQPLPDSLAEILKDSQLSDVTADPGLLNIDSQLHENIEKCLQWELRMYDACFADPSHSAFINFFVQEDPSVPTSDQTSSAEFLPSIWYDENGSEAPYPFAATPLPNLRLMQRASIAMSKARMELNPPEDSETSSYEPEESDFRRYRKRRRLEDSVTPITDRYLAREKPTRTRKARTKRGAFLGAPESQNQRPVIRNRPPFGIMTTPDGSTIPVKRQRGLHHLRALKEDEVYRIAVTVVVVKTLAGGLEKFTDWTLTMKLFPNKEEQWVKDRWKTIANRYRKDVQNLTESFQERYIVALERGEVPSVNFNDLELPDSEIGATGTDWRGIVKWAVASLDRFNIKKLGELPGTRTQLTEEKDLTFEEHKGLRELLGYNINATNPKKEELMAGIVWGVSMPIPPDVPASCPKPTPLSLTYAPETEELHSPALTLARSWVLATILTRSDHWDARAIRHKLLTLARTEAEIEKLVDVALEALQRDKVIVRNREARLTATMLGGGWEASIKFWEYWNFRRMVASDMLREAVQYKTDVLDKSFSDATIHSFIVNKTELLSDGQMVALLNLAAAGRLCVRPGQDVPNGRYGLDWQNKGYQTRLLDKKTLAFNVELVPGPEQYVIGVDSRQNPSLPRQTPVPRGEMDTLFDHGRRKGKIPMWFDVLGHFNHETWEMVVSAVVGLVSTRAGINSLEIRRTLNWAITGWELDLVMEWLSQGRYINRTPTGKGWITREWWWLVLGAGRQGSAGWDVINNSRDDGDDQHSTPVEGDRTARAGDGQTEHG